MLLEPIGYHVRKAVVPKVSPVDDAKPAVVKLLAGNHFEGAPVSLTFLMDRDGSCLDSAGLVQPQLQDAGSS